MKAKAFESGETVTLARELLGKFLVRTRADGTQDARMITEVEAYDGEHDLASHARAGRTKRTEVLYRAGGIWYVYLCYGIHEMLNLVVGPADWPAAILIRGIEGARGPGRVTKSLEINRTLNATPAAPESGLWIEDRDVVVPRRDIRATPRIGVDFAGPIWTPKPWRFVIEPPEQKSPPRAPRRPKSSPAPSPSI